MGKINMALLRPKLTNELYELARNVIAKKLIKNNFFRKGDDEIIGIADMAIATALNEFRFDKNCSLQTWVCNTGIFRAIDIIRALYGQRKNNYAHQKYNPLNKAYTMGDADFDFVESTTHWTTDHNRVDEIDAFEHRIAVLKPQEQEIMRLMYVNGLPMRIVADPMGVCESRISQIHRIAIKKLQKQHGRLTDRGYIGNDS